MTICGIPDICGHLCHLQTGTHAVRARLPEELWAAAAELAQREGMDVTARALEVDKPSLRLVFIDWKMTGSPWRV